MFLSLTKLVWANDLKMESLVHQLGIGLSKKMAERNDMNLFRISLRNRLKGASEIGVGLMDVHHIDSSSSAVKRWENSSNVR